MGDRESDIYELYCLSKELGTHFIVRTVVNRLAGDGDHTVSVEMQAAPSAGVLQIEVRGDQDEIGHVFLEVRFKRVLVLPPIGKQMRYPSLELSVIHATKINAPSGRKPIVWKLLTDFDVQSCEQAEEKIRWYALHWQIEVFHKVLKSGCRAEDAKLRTADRLANLVAVFCIVSWRVMQLTMMARAAPDAPPTIALTLPEITILDHLVSNSGNRGAKQNTLRFNLTKQARLGGYLSKASEPPPENTVVWRSLRGLADIHLGAEMIGGPRYG